jgi:putative heme-binding domain-containing protein
LVEEIQRLIKIDGSMHGGVIAGEKDAADEESGILSDTPELTTIRIATVRERMMYDVKELTIKPGKKVKLTFANIDYMPHNILLVKPGKADEIGLKAMALGARGFSVNYVPESSDILWASKLVDYGTEEVIEFTAPSTEGAYPYICSFPGHHLLMRGVLYITNDLKKFREENPEPTTKLTEWKVADLEEDLKRISQSRNFFQGQQLFTTLACAQCHRLSDKVSGAIPMHGTNPPSTAVGPMLSESVKKYKSDAKAILQEIIEPSRSIEDKYRRLMFELEDDVYFSGNVIAEDENSLTIQTGPSAGQEQKIAKNDIVSKRPSPVSMMPLALLNTLDKEQILDLLSFVLAEGDQAAPAFNQSKP